MGFPVAMTEPYPGLEGFHCLSHTEAELVSGVGCDMPWCSGPLSRASHCMKGLTVLSSPAGLSGAKNFRRKGIKVSHLSLVPEPANFKAPGCLWKQLPVGTHTAFWEQIAYC